MELPVVPASAAVPKACCQCHVAQVPKDKAVERLTKQSVQVLNECLDLFDLPRGEASAAQAGPEGAMQCPAGTRTCVMCR